VLLIDIDPQGNASSALSQQQEVASARSDGRTVYEALIGRHTMAAVIRHARENLELVPAGPDLVGVEVEMATMEGREHRLRSLILPIVENYDYLFIDTPPSLGLLTLNALVASASVLVPMQCEYYALEGLSALLATIKRIKAALNPELEIEGLVLTMFDTRNRLSHEIAREVRKHFPDKIFRSVIPRNVRLSESPSHGLSVLEYDANSSGAIGYRHLASELLRRGAQGAAAAD
jgi:chromosome partitioning protein